MIKLQFWLILFFLATSKLSSADCASNGMWSYPNHGSLVKGQIILLDGYAMSQRHINNLEVKCHAYLISSNHKIKLELVQINKGNFTLTQAVLKLNEALNSEMVYQLIIDYGTETPIYISRNDQDGEYKKCEYTLSNSVVTKAEFISPPIFKDHSFQLYGCGPAMFANFKLNANHTNCFVIVHVRKVHSSDVIEFWYPFTDFIKIGHNMCSGAISFEAKITYQIQFSLISQSGVLGSEPSDWINFESPNTYF